MSPFALVQAGKIPTNSCMPQCHHLSLSPNTGSTLSSRGQAFLISSWDLERGCTSSQEAGEKTESMAEVSVFSRGGEEKGPQRVKSPAAQSLVIGT